MSRHLHATQHLEPDCSLLVMPLARLQRFGAHKPEAPGEIRVQRPTAPDDLQREAPAPAAGQDVKWITRTSGLRVEVGQVLRAPAAQRLISDVPVGPRQPRRTQHRDGTPGRERSTTPDDFLRRPHQPDV